MSMVLDEKDLAKLIVIGDRVLIKPKTPAAKTKSGLYLPPGVEESEKVQIGYVVRVGPGYPVPSVGEIDEPWKPGKNEPHYLPLQPREGDMALYLQSGSVEIEFNREKYVIVSHSSMLLLFRDDGLFE